MLINNQPSVNSILRMNNNSVLCSWRRISSMCNLLLSKYAFDTFKSHSQVDDIIYCAHFSEPFDLFNHCVLMKVLSTLTRQNHYLAPTVFIQFLYKEWKSECLKFLFRSRSWQFLASSKETVPLSTFVNSIDYFLAPLQFTRCYRLYEISSLWLFGPLFTSSKCFELVLTSCAQSYYLT